MQDYSDRSLLEFLDYLGNKGLMKGSTVSARKAAVSSMLAVLDSEELTDLREIDTDDLSSRFANLKGASFTPGSLNTYKSRFTAALSDFLEYKKNPLSFKPKVKVRRRLKKHTENISAENQNSSGQESKPEQRKTSSSIDHSTLVFPIPIRPGIVIQIAGIPDDFSQSEAEKVSKVILALSNTGN